MLGGLPFVHPMSSGLLYGLLSFFGVGSGLYRVWIPRTCSLARLYPFRLHSKAFRLGVPRTLAALLPSPAPKATAEKLRVPTTPCVPAPAHLRKLGRVCGTTPRAGRLLCAAHHSLVGQ